MKPTSVGQLIACYEHINYLLTFSDVFLQGFTVFAGGRVSSIGPYGGGGWDCSTDSIVLSTSPCKPTKVKDFSVLLLLDSIFTWTTLPIAPPPA